MLQNSSDLYNGNIARMVTTITDPNSRAVLPLGNAYRYDQLNRLKHAVSFDQLNGNAWAGGAPAKYENSFTYDANGNILTQTRNDDNNQVIDELAYFYPQNAANKTVRNRLLYVSDNVDYDASDINPGMSTSNYAYDQEGLLTQDLQEQIASIEWRVDGKVKRINRIANSTKQNLSFDYENQRKLMKEERFAGKQNSAGEMGHRIAKHVYTSANVLEKSTYYVLDAQGNTMATYERAVDENTLQISYAQTEKFIYGSSRLGVQNCNIALLGSQNNSYTQTTVAHRIGKKGYELSNHLGNVLSVISDKAIPHSNGTIVDYWLADILQSTDYSPFGVKLNNRTLSKSGVTDFVRFGYQGSEIDKEVKNGANSYTTYFRQLDPRLGRWMSLDPKATAWESPYVSMGNNPIFYSDPDGDSVKYQTFKDRMNVLIGRIANKDFRKKFREQRSSTDVFTYYKNPEFGQNRLVNAEPCEINCLKNSNGVDYSDNVVYYDYGLMNKDISNPLARTAFNLGIRLPAGILTGIGIGAVNIFRPKGHKIGWGWGNQLVTQNEINIFSFGFGNYNKYNILGMKLSADVARINPNDGHAGLIGVRIGVGKKRPVNFVDIFQQIQTPHSNTGYHFHMNFASKSKRRSALSGEAIIDLKNI